MFSPQFLMKNLRPHGMKPEVVEVDPPEPQAEVPGITWIGTDRRYYRAKFAAMVVKGTLWADCEVHFSIPKCDDLGIFEVNGLRRYIVKEGFVDVTRTMVGRPHRFIFRNSTTVLTRALNEIFHSALTEFWMRGQPPSENDLQSAIDAWFVISPLTHDVDGNELTLQSMRELVYLRLPTDTLDLDDRIFQGTMKGVLDPASTPQGDKVNLAFRMTKDTKLVNGNPQTGGHFFCSTIQDHGIAGKYTPRRMHLLRSAFEHSLDLVEPEIPIIGSNALHGCNLLTAIMNFRSYTGEDAIAISETAAKKMRAIRKCRETLYLIGDIHVKVKEGDHVSPGDLLAEAADPMTGKKREFYSSKLRHPSELIRLRCGHTSVSGIPAIKVTFDFVAEVEIETGDKIFTRSAVKGVAYVVEDHRMPVTNQGERIEVCISPESVINRRAMGVYWEMMANQYARETGETVDVGHMSPSPSFEGLVGQGYGASQQLYLKNDPLKHETYVGPMFFIRIDKIAKEIVTGHDGHLRLNGHGVQVNQARVSGQKRDLAKNLTMLARGLENNLLYSLETNMHGQHAFEELSKVLRVEAEPEFVESDRVAEPVEDSVLPG